MAALELGVGGEDEDPVAYSSSLGAWLGENMVGVGVDDLFDQDRMAQLLYVAVQVDDSDHVQSSTGENASQTAAEVIAHFS